MRDAVIVEAVRTPVGRRGGLCRGAPGRPVGARAARARPSASGIDPAVVDDVIWGCVGQVGEQAFNIARNAVLAAGWPESVPGITIDRQCGSSQQAVHFAAAGGDRRPVRRRGRRRRRVDEPGADGLARSAGRRASRSGRGCWSATAGVVPQPGRRRRDDGRAVGAVAAPSSTSSRLGSHEKAAAAQADGAFDGQIAPVTAAGRRRWSRRRGHPRAAARSTTLAALKTAVQGRTAWSPRATPRRSPTARPRC